MLTNIVNNRSQLALLGTRYAHIYVNLCCVFTVISCLTIHIHVPHHLYERHNLFNNPNHHHHRHHCHNNNHYCHHHHHLRHDGCQGLGTLEASIRLLQISKREERLSSPALFSSIVTICIASNAGAETFK
uniref:Uncharacterized protein n=1 Tax=Glossina brevipalpis TaxID=37001 RepID=A0A1A9WBG7_9MUSC